MVKVVYSRVLSVLAMLAAVSGIPAVQAQTASGSATPDTELGNVVASSNSSTSLQVATADAIQNTCVGLSQRDSLSAPESALFTNCSDMVLTAFALDPNLSSDLSLGWTSTQLAEGMQQLAGEEQTSTGRLATETSNGQYANLGMRLDAIRAGARATAGGINVAVNGAPLTGGNAGDDGTGWGWFLNGGFGTGDRDATVRENAYDYDSWGGTLGADYQFASGLVAGVALGYYDYQVDFDDVSSAESGQKLVNTPGAYVHEIGGTETHVHVCVTVVPTILMSEMIGQLKGGSAHEVNEKIGHRSKRLQWQTGYGVVSFGTRDLDWVKTYVRNQREHHAAVPATERWGRFSSGRPS
mgnify:CR=1 FL=1